MLEPRRSHLEQASILNPGHTIHKILTIDRLLGDLDEQLLRSLDNVCRDNQLTAFPISRGRNSTEYVYEKYPELVSSIEADRRRLVDFIRLKSHTSKVDIHEGKSRAFNEKTSASPSISKSKAGAERERIASVQDSPLLRSKQSTGDLMFQMDDEPLPAPLEPGKGKAVDRGPRPAESEIRAWNDTPVIGSSLQDASFGSRSYLDDRMASPRDANPVGLQATTPDGKTNGSVSPPHVPWSSTPISGSKKALKDIMNEASEDRVSNLSLGMTARPENNSSFVPKLSQKERKKMQQQQMQEMATSQQKAKEVAQSPWKIPDPAPAVPTGNTPNASGQDVSSPSPTPSKFPQRPGMTLRQTIAGAPPPKNESPAKPAPPKAHSTSAATATQPRSRPSDIAAPSAPSTEKAPAPPSIQSVRHIPRPEPYQKSFHSDSPSSTSLATILMQQQTEKDEIREAATAKHNLQDIQAEQAFQEWWDKESRRVQGLPEPASESSQGQGQDSRQRGSRGGRGGSGRGNSKSSGQHKRRGKGAHDQPSAGPQGTTTNAPSPAQQGARGGAEHAPASRSHAHGDHHQQAAKKSRADSAAPANFSRRGGRGGYRGKQSEGQKA